MPSWTGAGSTRSPALMPSRPMAAQPSTTTACGSERQIDRPCRCDCAEIGPAKALLQPHSDVFIRAQSDFDRLRPLSVVHAIVSDLHKTRVVARLAAMRAVSRNSIVD